MKNSFALLGLLLSLSYVRGEITQDTGGDIPLANKHFTWPDLPYKADTGSGPRGTQNGVHTKTNNPH